MVDFKAALPTVADSRAFKDARDFPPCPEEEREGCMRHIANKKFLHNASKFKQTLTKWRCWIHSIPFSWPALHYKSGNIDSALALYSNLQAFVHYEKKTQKAVFTFKFSCLFGVELVLALSNTWHKRSSFSTSSITWIDFFILFVSTNICCSTCKFNWRYIVINCKNI